MINRSVTGVILSGGAGQRMGGVDKGLVDYAGSPLISYALALLAPQVDRCVINANRSIDSYCSFNVDVCKDVEAGFAGPLMGMVTGLSVAKTDWVVFIPCDAPMLPPFLVTRLFMGVEKQNSKIAVAHDGSRLQPVISLLHISLLPELKLALKNGHFKLQNLFLSLKAEIVDFSDCSDCFVNINSPSDLKDLINKSN